MCVGRGRREALLPWTVSEASPCRLQINGVQWVDAAGIGIEGFMKDAA